jgi:hypothetical protein
MRIIKAQLSLEALIVFSEFLAFLLLLFSSFLSLNARAEKLGEELAARSCASGTAELAGYYGLDGLHSHFPLEISDSVEVGGEIRCTRGSSSSSVKVLVIKVEKEPV